MYLKKKYFKMYLKKKKNILNAFLGNGLSKKQFEALKVKKKR